LHFRSHPNPKWRMEAPLIRHRQERDLFFYVAPTMNKHPLVIRALRKYSLVLITTWPTNEYLLWPVPVIDQSVDRKPIKSIQSQHTALERSEHIWTRMEWDESEGNFSVEAAENLKQDPVWPEKENLTDFLKLAFAGKVIDNPEHDYVRQLRGIAT